MRKLVTAGMCAALVGCAAKGAEPVGVVEASGERPSFEAFRAEAFQDESGVWVYDGDLPASDEEDLRALYEELFPRGGALIVQQVSGRDRVWSSTEKHQLTYCVSTAFGARYGEVLAATQQAADDWMAVADVSFQHVPEEDGRCDASNPRVLFDVRPSSTTRYLARAFFPGFPRAQRNVLVSSTAFGSSFTLVGVLRHELGHVLGFLHEHIRPPGTSCPEGGRYRELTPYDPNSAMHYPQCGGSNFRLELSTLDAAGASAVYGAPVASTPEPEPEPAPAPTPVPRGTPRSGSASASVARGQEIPFSPLAVFEGSTFEVSMTGSGDADLYVAFDRAPTTRSFDCRPFTPTSTETCSLTVPAGATEAHVMIRGYTAASFRIDARWVAP